jgi:hypothetical protein
METKTVRSESEAIAAMGTQWPMILALLSGTSAMRKGTTKYLPQWPNEQAESYASRLATATLYPAFSRTVEVMASKPFSKPVAIDEGTPPRIVEWLDDVDLSGRNLHAFAADVMLDCISYGLSGVLVDYPQASEVRTRADEMVTGVRPYFAHYKPQSILGWKSTKRNGMEVLTQVRLLESVEEEDGPFGTKQVEQVRVLEPGLWFVYRKLGDNWVVYDEGTTTLSEIPFVFFYGIRKSFGIGVAPLLELAFQNVEHWQSLSDQQTILHVARVPILVTVGADNTSITVGASSAVGLPVGADMRFVEHSGQAIEAGRKSLLDLEERMRQTGAELLVLKPGDITATQVTSENEANRCTLQKIVEVFEDCLDQCLQYMADWVGEAEGGSVSLFTDFGAATLGEASAELLLKANQSGKLSDETMFDEWKRRGIISPENEWNDEQERIQEQGMALGMAEDETQPTQQIEPVEPVANDNEDSANEMEAVTNALSELGSKVETLAAQVAEPQVAEIDLSAIESKIAYLATVVAQLAARHEAPQQQAQPAPIFVMDNQGNIKKQITLVYGADGKPSGATVETTLQ